jgi:uncharacterized membrane protein
VTNLANILESCMLVAFGLAWPANIRNSLKVKCSKGRSVQFLYIIMIGYVFGLSAKLVSGQINYVTFFYILNLCMVAFDTVLYYYYRHKDRLNAARD